MPTYVYECPSCHDRVEIVCKITDERIDPLCMKEKCDLRQMERVISASAFILKGSGWARDGYGGKK